MGYTPITLPYKAVQSLSIEVDVYLPPPDLDSGLTQKRPTVVFFHGGGLNCGDKRSWFPDWIADAVHKLGWILVSADYRLMPPANGHILIEDVQDLFVWLRDAANDSLQKTEENKGRSLGIDAERIVVAGSSAGGYLTLLSGLYADPKPKALLSIFGVGGNLLTDQYLVKKTKPFFMNRPLLDPTSPELAAFTSLSDPPPPSSGSEVQYVDGVPSEPRMHLSRLFLQEAVMLNYLTGDHSFSDQLNKIRATATSSKQLEDAVPLEHRPIFPQLHITSAFPPTLMLHGVADTAVLIRESRHLEKLLTKAGVKCKLIEVDGAEHGFDKEPAEFARYLEQVFPWIKGILDELVSG